MFNNSLRSRVGFVTFKGCKSLRLRVTKLFVRGLYFLRLGVENAYVLCFIIPYVRGLDLLLSRVLNPYVWG